MGQNTVRIILAFPVLSLEFAKLDGLVPFKHNFKGLESCSKELLSKINK